MSSFKLYFAVAGLVFGLSVFVLLILFCYFLRTRGKKSSRCSEASGDSEKNIYVDPYSIGDALARADANSHYAKSDISYAKPAIYTTYLNPSYEHTYEKWKTREKNISEKHYDSPWTTLFSKLPRAQLSIDHASLKSNDIIGPAKANHLRDKLPTQSPANKPALPPRFQPIVAEDTNSESYIDITVTGVPEEEDSANIQIDGDTKDGLTYF